jgi:hypothetical protein
MTNKDPKPDRPKRQGGGTGDKFGKRGWKPPKPKPNEGQIRPPGGPGGVGSNKEC